MKEGPSSGGGGQGPSADLLFPEKFLWGAQAAPGVVDPSDFARLVPGGFCKLVLPWRILEPREGHEDGLEDPGLKAFLNNGQFKLALALDPLDAPDWAGGPQAWDQPRTLDAFESLAGRIAGKQRGKVQLWCTVEDPLRALEGERGLLGAVTSRGWNRLANLLSGHGRAYRILQREDPGSQAGLSLSWTHCRPHDPRSWLDRWAARRAHESLNRRILAALWEGVLHQPLGRHAVPEAKGAFDYLGLSYRGGQAWTFGWSEGGGLGPRAVGGPPTNTARGQADPSGLSSCLESLKDLGKPLVVFDCSLEEAEDDVRSTVLVSYLDQVGRAAATGPAVDGFCYGPLADMGSPRGLCAQSDGRLQPRPSADLYAEVCREGRIPGIWQRQFGLPWIRRYQ